MARRTTDRTAVEQVEWMRNLLAFMLVGAFVSLVPLFVFKDIPSGNKEVVSYIAGQLSGMALMALGFYFVNKAGQDTIDAARTDNTAKALDAIKATAHAASSGSSDAASQAADETAEAAVHKAAEIKGDI